MMQRRDFLKRLGLLALSALPACRRAQEQAVLPEEGPEWQQAGEGRHYCTCMPWPNGAWPLLAACPGGLPIALHPHPLAAQRGLPALVQAALLDLYDNARAHTPHFHGKPYPWQALRGAFRAWAQAMHEGRRTGILFPSGYSPLRQQQVQALQQLNPHLRCYTWDPLAEPRPTPPLPELARQQQAALGRPCRWNTGMGSLAELTRELPQLELLFIFCPADPAAHNAAFAAALAHCEAETLRFHPRGGDRTASLCHYLVPQTHFLEEWGAEADAQGQLCLRQPLTLPLRPALSEADALAALLEKGQLPDPHSTPARRWLERCIPNLEHALRRGLLPHAAPLPDFLPPGGDARLYLHPTFADGRFTHNAWLREAYDSLSGAAGAPAAYLPGAAASGCVELGSAKLCLPACRLPDLPHPLLPQLPGIAATTPARWMPSAGPFPRQATQPAPALRHAPAPERPPTSAQPQWGLHIELAACIGCQACTLACRAENNIPTVGAAEQARGRDLQWLQILRHVDALGRTRFFRPLTCRHCAEAPCEAACPANATLHSSDGLNTMAYARCWGTRYCAAACPYGVRRFNFHDYAPAAYRHNTPPPNPQVTVRPRGVMEKCTLCVQRINAAKARAAVEGSALTPPQAACAAACPTGALQLVDLCRDAAPAALITNFDAPGTQPRMRYIARR